MATVAEIIDRALRSIKAIDSLETVPAQTYTDHLETLNGMLKSWSTGPQMIYAPSQVTHSVAVDTTSFTIGSGADLDTTRPKVITSAYLRDADNTDYDLKIRSLDEYAEVILKTVAGRPEYIYLRKGYPNWTVYFDTKSDQAYTLYLELLQPLTTYTATTDTFSMPGEYEDAVVYNLAVRLQPEYPVTDSFSIVSQLAMGHLQMIKNLNIHPVRVAKMDVPGRYRRSDIYEG